MKVARWGNSLAVRLPRSVVDALGIEEGDEVQVEASEPGRLIVSRDRSREAVLDEIRAMRVRLPLGYIFDREEANER